MFAQKFTTPSIVGNLWEWSIGTLKTLIIDNTYDCIFHRTIIVEPSQKASRIPIGITWLWNKIWIYLKNRDLSTNPIPHQTRSLQVYIFPQFLLARPSLSSIKKHLSVYWFCLIHISEHLLLNSLEWSSCWLYLVDTMDWTIRTTNNTNQRQYLFDSE